MVDHQAIARRLLRDLLAAHPLPWRVDRDWTWEVIAADGTTITKCATGVLADAIVAEAEAVGAENVRQAAACAALLRDHGIEEPTDG